MAFRWRADDGPLIVLVGSYHHKKRCKVGPPLAKLSGSAHAHLNLGPCFENIALARLHAFTIAAFFAIVPISLEIAHLNKLEDQNS